jgi:hypothetical protein
LRRTPGGSTTLMSHAFAMRVITTLRSQPE